MARAFHFRIVTREGAKFDGPVVYARLHAQDGYFGVMADHAPLIAVLTPGDLVVTEKPGRTPLVFAAGAGVVEVRDNEGTALVDTAERAEEIDIARAREAAERARSRLNGPRSASVDLARAQAALQRALARLHAAGDGAGKSG
jgi:F-type H+-transporting ATPase subunit epsilon